MTQDHDAILSANRAFYDAMETGDLDLMEAVWTEDGCVCVHPATAPIHGRAAVLRSLALIMANTDYIQFFITDVEVSRAGDRAVVTCTENILAAADGSSGEERAGESPLASARATALNVFVRSDEGLATVGAPRHLGTVRSVMTTHAAAATSVCCALDTPDRLSVLGLEARGFHGVLEHERQEGQVFRVDFTLGLDTRTAAGSDDLQDTVDYGTLSAKVRAIVEGGPVDLIETLAHRIATECLRHSSVQWVEVTVHKPEAPIEATFSDVALTIRRSRGRADDD